MLERRMVHLGELATEQRNPRSAHIDTAGTAELLSIINKDDQGVAPAVEAAIGQIAPLLDHLTAQVRAGGRLFYIGAGTSGRLGVLDASECPPTFGVSPEMVQGIMAGGMEALYRATEATEDDPASGAADLETRGFRAGDVLVGIAASGRTPYVIGAVRAARAMGAVTAAVVCAEGSALGGEVDYPIAVPVGPEVVTGSTRMKAGTATKLVLNMISTGLMIRLGYTYGNLMVNVQPKNEKLVDRARRIVAEAGQVDGEKAIELFEAGGRSVKVAIVMARMGVDREKAEALLIEKGGVLAEVLRG